MNYFRYQMNYVTLKLVLVKVLEHKEWGSVK